MVIAMLVIAMIVFVATQTNKVKAEGETEKIFKGEIVDWDDNEGLKFFRFDDGEELQIPKSNIQSAKLYIDQYKGEQDD